MFQLCTASASGVWNLQGFVDYSGVELNLVTTEHVCDSLVFQNTPKIDLIANLSLYANKHLQLEITGFQEI